MNIGEKLKKRRKELDLTMLQVAKITGVSEATVSRWESGDIANMRRDKIVSLAKALKVQPAFIMEETNTITTNGTHDNFTQPQQSEIETLYSQLDSEDKAEVRGMIKGLLRADKYQKSKPNTNIADDMTNMLKAANFLSTKQK